METQDGNHHLEKQKKLDNRARRVNKAGQLKKTLESTSCRQRGHKDKQSRCFVIYLQQVTWLSSSELLLLQYLYLYLHLDVFEVVYLSAGRAGGRMPLLLEEDARHFSQTGSELLRDSLISSDFRVSSGNYRSYSVGSKYTHTQIRTHRLKQEWATHLHNVSCHLEPLCRW